jgi:hypothetical protein
MTPEEQARTEIDATLTVLQITRLGSEQSESNHAPFSRRDRLPKALRRYGVQLPKLLDELTEARTE